MDSYTNRTFDEIELGETIVRSHRLTRPDVEALAFVSGDVDPFHTTAASARQDTMSAEAVAAEAGVSALPRSNAATLTRPPGPPASDNPYSPRRPSRRTSRCSTPACATAHGPC